MFSLLAIHWGKHPVTKQDTKQLAHRNMQEEVLIGRIYQEFVLNIRVWLAIG